MANPLPGPTESSRPDGAVWPRWPWLGLAVVILAAAGFLGWKSITPSVSAPLREVERTDLVLNAGRLEWNGHPLDGWLVEHYPGGGLKSRSAVAQGRLHGLSEGWFTNEVRQVAEHFVDGVSHGERLRWTEQGKPVSSARIEHGRIVGVFRRWHDNGAVAEEITMKDGESDGPCRVWYPSGFLKAEATYSHGKVVTRTQHKDGERRDDTVAVEPLGGR